MFNKKLKREVESLRYDLARLKLCTDTDAPGSLRHIIYQQQEDFNALLELLGVERVDLVRDTPRFRKKK